MAGRRLSPAAAGLPAAVSLVLALGLALAGCSSGGGTARHAAAASPAVARPGPSMTVPRYTETILIEAERGSRPTCRAPAVIRRGTWYMVREYGNAPVSFEIPGVPGASRPIARTATYTDSDFEAVTAGTFRLVITPAPAKACQFTVR
jgi:hypothetical protein